MNKTIKLTPNGYKKLVQRKKKLFSNLKEVQGKKGEAAEVGGNVWHDNFSFEELGRQEAMLNKKISDIHDILNGSEITHGEPNHDDFLQIGHIGVFELDDEAKERFYEIRGFGESDLKSDPPKIEYLAPLVEKLIGKEVGASAKVEIAGKMKEITLVEIKQKSKGG